MILRLLTGLSIAAAVFPAFASEEAACPQLRFDDSVAPKIGRSLGLMETGDAPVTLQPMLAGLKGPRVTLLGRDIRLAVKDRQASPQELWHQARFNADRGQHCHESYAFYQKLTFDNAISPTRYDPSIIFRTRIIADGMLTTPLGFTFGAGIALPIKSNSDALMDQPDTRLPVRRDIGRFSQNVTLEHLFASWHTTPITDVHLALTAGWLEQMYAGVGAEMVWRPFGSAFWLGADGWQVWRRDADSTSHLQWTAHDAFTGFVRAGYDMPGTRFSASIAAGKFLAGDNGAMVAMTQGLGERMRLEGSVSWSNRRQDAYLPDAKWDPRIRLVVPIGKAGIKNETRMSFYQLGRDSAQMLDRPMPLEDMTQPFAAREYIRHWPQLFD